MSTTSVTTTNIPKLTHHPSTYAGWRTAIEVALQLADSWNAGLDAEPNRARWINRAPGATGTVLARNTRAGPAMPEASKTTSGNAMTAEERKEWKKWQTRESKAQGMLKALVSLAIKLDLDDLKSAGDMWTHCEHPHALNIVEDQREVRRKLYSLDLQDDATSEEMAAHEELFSRLIMEAKLVGIGYTSHEREAMFVGTILGPAFRPVIAEINAVAEANRDWPLVHSKYNAESARRKARPLVRPTAPRGGSKALYDEHESWAGLTVGSEPIQSWSDMIEMMGRSWNPSNGQMKERSRRILGQTWQCSPKTRSYSSVSQYSQHGWSTAERRTTSPPAENCFEMPASSRNHRCLAWRTRQRPRRPAIGPYLAAVELKAVISARLIRTAKDRPVFNSRTRSQPQ
jgi:hypothetical protein